MRLRRLHHRLAVGMGIAATVAFAGGAGAQPVSVALTLAALVIALLWHPDQEQTRVLQRVLGVAAVVLVLRAGYQVLFLEGDRLATMVDLLLLLLVAESLKTPRAVNDVRLYTLSFALLLASTVYRPGFIFALAFVGYVGFATVAVMVGHLRRKSERFGVRDVTIDRRFLYGTGILSLVTLVISAVLFLAFPRVSRGWMSGGRVFATQIAGFADEVSIGEHGARIESNPAIVLRVEFPDDEPPPPDALYWRGRSYDRFDGVRWSHSEGLPPSSPRLTFYERRWSGPVVRQEVYGAPLRSRVLFGLHPALSIRAYSRMRIQRDAAGDLRYVGANPPVYSVTSYQSAPPPAELRRSPDQNPRRFEHYRALPELPARFRRLADSLTAGQSTLYDQVRAVERWFHDEFSYTRELPATAREATLEYFLFERRAGHCEYFSTGMATLLRSVGIAARNVNGFLGGEWNDVGSYLAVTQNEAHSWVEVWFPAFGWVRFDPTPASTDAGAGGGLGWFWPGRFLLDGLQHRWNKWVLDYNLDRQLTLFERTTDLVGGRDGAAASDGGTGEADPRWLPATLLVATVLAAVWLWLGGRGKGRGPATRVYLKLRRAYERHGYADVPRTPLSFARTLQEEIAPGAKAASRIVGWYVATRFGGRSSVEGEGARMERELKQVKRALRARRRKQ